jgi:hypothetical protein
LRDLPLFVFRYGFCVFLLVLMKFIGAKFFNGLS